MSSMPTPRSAAMARSGARSPQRPVAGRRANGRPTAASSPRLPSAWRISACAWPSTITWARSSRPTRRSACSCGIPAQAVGLLYDTGHSVFRRRRSAGAGQGARRSASSTCIARMPAGRCWSRARREDMSFMGAVMEGIFTVPGRRLHRLSCDPARAGRQRLPGWLVVEAEQDPSKAHPLTYATMGFENLSRMAREAGFRLWIERASMPPGRNQC